MSGEEHVHSSASAGAAGSGVVNANSAATNGDAAAANHKLDASAASPQTPANGSKAGAPGPEDAKPEPKQPRAPKLAPAPVPQQTPWKAPTIDAAAKPPIETVDVAQQKRTEQRDPKAREAKRSTTGKEKWVPYTPAPAPLSAGAQSAAAGGQRGKPARRGGSNAAYRGQRRPDRGDKRQPRSHSGSPAPQAAQKHHARSQSAAAPAQDDAEKLERLSLDDRRAQSSQPFRGPAPGSQDSSTDSISPATSAGSNGAANGSAQPQPQHPRKREHQRKPPYYQPQGFVPMSYPMQMVRMPVPGGQIAPGVSPVNDPAAYMFNTLVAQVDYYFSVENLCKDMYLRKQMNDQGFVPVATIGAFNRVKSLAPNTDVVAEACRWAPNVEVAGAKARAAKGWENWVMPESERLPAGLDNTPVQTDDAPKFQIDQAKPFVPKNQ